MDQGRSVTPEHKPQWVMTSKNKSVNKFYNPEIKDINQVNVGKFENVSNKK